MGEKRGLKALQAWCRKVTEGYKNVSVTDMSMSWKDGLAFCAIIHHFRPDLVDFDSLTKDNILLNNRLAFTVAEQSLGIPALLDEEDMVRYSEPDKLSIATYVSQYYQFFEGRNRGTTSNNLHTSKLSMKRPFNDRAFAPQALPAKIPGVAPRGFFKDEKCSSCGHRVYILERLMVDSKLYHRTCFTCNKCQTLLRPGAYAASDVEGKFECIECPSEETVSAPETETPNGPVAIVVDEESKDSGTFDDQSLGGSSGVSELKLSNSFISARKKFFEHSLEDAKPNASQEESMKLSIDEGLVLREIEAKNDSVSDSLTNNKEDSFKTDFKETKAYTSVSEIDVIKNSSSSDNDLETPVNKIAFKFPEKAEILEVPEVSEIEMQDTEPPKLPTSEIPRDSKTENESVPVTEPPQKTPRKMKRLSVDVSSWKQDDASALPSSPPATAKSSMSPTLSLPVISSISPVSPLRKGRSGGLQPTSKSTRSSLPPTELTNAEKNRNSLELKGTYQSPLSGTFKWKSYERQSGELKDSPESPSKPKIPEKPAFIAAKSAVPTKQTDTKDTLPKDDVFDNRNEDLNPFGDDETIPEVPQPPKDAKMVDKSSKEVLDVPKPDVTEVPEVSVPPKDAEVVDKSLPEVPKVPIVSVPPKDADIVDKSPPEVPKVPEVSVPSKEVKVIVKVKPARPPKPVMKETKTEVTPNLPNAVVKEIEYPDDLNPFGDEETDDEVKNEYPDDLNPFDDEEDQPVTPVNELTDPTPSFQSASSQSLSKIEAYDSKLNPFGDSDEDELTDAQSLSRDSHYSYDCSHQSLPTTPRSSSRQSRTLGRQKKRPAPLPPSLQPGFREGHHSDFNISMKGSPSPSRSSLQGSLRGSPRSSKKAAPRPPIIPPLASTPKKTDTQDLSVKALKEQNNKTMKELVDSAPDKSEDDQNNTFGYWKKKKRPAPSVPIPPRRQIKMIPVKEIQSELLEIEEKQKDLESQGRDLETMIRDFNQGEEEEASVDEEELILQLFELVNQKNILFRRQAELMYIKRSQSLEQEQADIEYKYRLIASKPEKLKTEEEKKKEDHLLQRLIEIVELRNEIVESMDMDRQRVQDEDLSIQEQMAQRQGQLQERLSPDSTSVSEPVEEDDKTKKEKKKHKLKFIKRDKSKDTKDKSKDKAKDTKDKKEAKAKAKEDAKTKAKEDESLWKFAKKDKKKT